MPGRCNISMPREISVNRKEDWFALWDNACPLCYTDLVRVRAKLFSVCTSKSCGFSIGDKRMGEILANMNEGK